jgi:hypothetical protein
MSESQKKERSRLKPFSWSELDALPGRRPLVKGLLDEGTLSVVYGESNCGKTFFVLDVALHLALGWSWHEKKVKAAGVIYIAAEGGFGIRERLRAFKIHHPFEGDPPFYVLPTAIDLCSQENDVEDLVYELREFNDIGLIVIDTLSRAMAGGNENSSEDREVSKPQICL